MIAVPLAVGAVLLVLLTAPVSLPLVVLLHARDGRRLSQAAAGARRARCGQTLSHDSLDADDAAWADWAAELADMPRRFPGARLRVVRHCRARCAACSMEHGWDERNGTLLLLTQDDSRSGMDCRAE